MTQPQKYTKDMLSRIVKSIRESTLATQMESDIDALDAMDLIDRLNVNNLVVVDTTKDEEQIQQKLEALQRQAGTFQYGEKVVPVSELGPLFGKR